MDEPERERSFLKLMRLIERRYSQSTVGGTDTSLQRREEIEIIQKISGLLRKHESDVVVSCVLSVLGASRTSESVKALAEAIEMERITNHNSTIRQAVASIDSLSFYANEEPVRSALKETEMAMKLRKLTTDENAINERIESALRTLANTL